MKKLRGWACAPTRADDSGASTWSLIREIRPVPREIKNTPEVRVGFRILQLLILASVIVVPLLLRPIKVNLLFEQAVMFALIGISLVILTGWAGEISLGQVAFFALGAATAAKFDSLHWHFFLCLLMAGFVGALSALVIGIPAALIALLTLVALFRDSSPPPAEARGTS